MPISSFREGVSTSPQNVISRIDGLFEFYLAGEGKKERHPGDPPDLFAEHQRAIKLLQAIFATRKSISALIKEAYKDEIDFDSKDEFNSPEALKEFLGKIIGFPDKYYDRKPRDYRRESMVEHTTPIAMAGREMLENNEIQQVHMYILSRFATYLTSMYITDQETNEEMAAAENFDAKIAYHFNFLIPVVHMMAVAGLDAEYQKQLLHSLMAVEENDVDAKTLEAFIEQVKALFSTFRVAEEEQIPVALRQLKDIFMAHIPACWRESVETEKFKMVILENRDKTNVHVVPPDNFYFDQSGAAEYCEADRFPENGKLEHAANPRALIGGRDVSVFDIYGHKRFWGDLLQEDIRHLQGTYYVLSAKDSYHQVPKSVILSESLAISHDKNRPEGAYTQYMPREKTDLDPGYVRIKALGKIKGGQYCEKR